MIDFKTKLETINGVTLAQLPEEASAQLPSRGMIMVKGTINGKTFQAALEPDGKKGHWLKVEADLQKLSGAAAGDTVALAIEATKEWPEPTIPADIVKALAADSEANALWAKITPMARWEWIRWIRSTANVETRKRRIEVACSKLTQGDRRPCCFNRAECTEPAVSKAAC